MAIQVDVEKKLFAPRVEDAVKHLASGESYKQTARELEIDAETVKSYATAFRRIMQAKSTAEAVAKAVARGVISIKEVDVKTILACALIGLTGMNSDFVMAKQARKPRTVRHEDADAQPEDVGQMVFKKSQGAAVCIVVSSGLSGSAVR